MVNMLFELQAIADSIPFSDDCGSIYSVQPLHSVVSKGIIADLYLGHLGNLCLQEYKLSCGSFVTINFSLETI
jgi:hypothetical protein